MSTNLFFTKIKRKSSVNGETFRIANGAQDSNIFNFRRYMFSAEAVIIYSPSTLPETITIKGSPDYEADEKDNQTIAGTFFTLNDLTNAATKVPAAGTCIIYNGLFTGFGGVLLHAGGAVAADRDFFVTLMTRA
jgi:hypothetical protein